MNWMFLAVSNELNILGIGVTDYLRPNKSSLTYTI